MPDAQSTSTLVFERVVGSIASLASADDIAHARAMEYRGGDVDETDSYAERLDLGDDFHLGRSAGEWVIVPGMAWSSITERR